MIPTARMHPFAINSFSKLTKSIKIPAIIGAKESPAYIVVLKNPIARPLSVFILATASAKPTVATPDPPPRLENPSKGYFIAERAPRLKTPVQFVLRFFPLL